MSPAPREAWHSSPLAEMPCSRSMSAPAQKPRPAPVSTTTRTWLSRAASAMAKRMLAAMRLV